MSRNPAGLGPVGVDISVVTQLLEGAVRSIDKDSIRAAALIVADNSETVDEARDILNMLGIRTQEV